MSGETQVATGRPRAEAKLLSFYRELRPLLDDLEAELAEKSFSGFS